MYEHCHFGISHHDICDNETCALAQEGSIAQKAQPTCNYAAGIVRCGWPMRPGFDGCHRHGRKVAAYR